jgi:thiamine pyrophosphokinase
MSQSHIEAWARSAEVVLAADGGANVLNKVGIRADAAIGDFDSIESAARQTPMEVVYDPDQDRSDCDKLLALAVQRGYSEITLCNIEGDRLDHVLATLHSATRSPLNVRLALRNGLGHILKGECDLALDAMPGENLSLMPLETCTGVTLTGVAWGLHQADLSGRQRVSLSNMATHDQVTVNMETGAAVLFITTQRLTTPTW